MNARISNLYINHVNPNATDQALAVDNTAGGVQFSALHSDTDYVLIDVQDADVRMTLDGSAPTASNGHLLQSSQGLLTMGAELIADAKFIRDDATDAVIHLTEFVD